MHQDFSIARNVPVTPVQSRYLCGRDFPGKTFGEGEGGEEGEMIFRRIRMIDARRVARSIHRWLLSHLTALCATDRANTPTRAGGRQYRALETLIPEYYVSFRLQTGVKNFYELGVASRLSGARSSIMHGRQFLRIDIGRFGPRPCVSQRPVLLAAL